MRGQTGTEGCRQAQKVAEGVVEGHDIEEVAEGVMEGITEGCRGSHGG